MADIGTGPHKCFFNCGASLETKFCLPSKYAGWDWFTGYAKDTMHFCPLCRKSRAEDIEKIRWQANTRPENYPNERAVISDEFTKGAA